MKQYVGLDISLSVILDRLTRGIAAYSVAPPKPAAAILSEAGRVFLDEARGIIERSRRAGEPSRAADRGGIGRQSVALFGSSI